MPLAQVAALFCQANGKAAFIERAPCLPEAGLMKHQASQQAVRQECPIYSRQRAAASVFALRCPQCENGALCTV